MKSHRFLTKDGSAHARSLIGVLVAIAVSGFATESSSEDDQQEDPSAPRFVSPDGRYGLLVTEADAESQNDRVEVIELPTKRSLIVLNDPEAFTDRANDARLDWSDDSQRVAAYTGGQRGGRTRVFARDGDGFVEVKLPKLPDLPDLENPSAAFRKKHKFQFLKWITTGSTEFVQWLPSGDLELKSYSEIATEEGGAFSAQITATIAIDSKHRATLKNVVREETLE